MSRKRRLAIAILSAIILLGVVGGVGFWKYHEQPQFCGICHIMDPYLESWQGSDLLAYAHAQEAVTCLNCHEPTLQQQMQELEVYVRGEFTVPLKERKFPVEFCFDCHLPHEHTSYEEIIQRTAGLELNPHDSHISEINEMDCSICHKMHKPSEDYCAQCHGPVATGPGWTTPVSPTTEVLVWEPDMDCTACHVMVPYLESLQDANLLAYAHAQEGLVCLDCHELAVLEQVHEEAVPGTPIKARKFEMDFCFDCHLPNEHTSYAEVIERTKEYTVDDQKINPHNPHAGVEGMEQLECSSCHKMHKESPLINYCYACHHAGTFANCSECHGE